MFMRCDTIIDIIRRATATSLLLLLSSHASAVTPALLIDPDLKPRPINLQAFGGSRVTYFDAERRLQIEPTGDILQIRFPTLKENENRDDAVTNDDPNSAKASAVIELTDGQRVTGTWQGADQTGEVLSIRHRVLGELKIKLDRVRSLSLNGEPITGKTPTSDELVLANGDVIKGFVVALHAKEAEVQPDGSTKSIKLPIERIVAVRLANPPAPATKRAHVAWLRDGSRVRCTSLDIASDRMAIQSTLSAGEKQIELKNVARIELASLAGRLIDLADLPYEIVAGGKVFGLPTPPRKNAGDSHGHLELHAPIKVVFELPPRTQRFAAVTELNLTQGADARWADFLVNIRVDGTSVARERISSKSPMKRVNVKAAGKTLEIELDDASNGPVLDRLRLRDAMLFIEAAE